MAKRAHKTGAPAEYSTRLGHQRQRVQLPAAQLCDSPTCDAACNAVRRLLRRVVLAAGAEDAMTAAPPSDGEECHPIQKNARARLQHHQQTLVAECWVGCAAHDAMNPRCERLQGIDLDADFWPRAIRYCLFTSPPPSRYAPPTWQSSWSPPAPGSLRRSASTNTAAPPSQRHGRDWRRERHQRRGRHEASTASR